MLPSPTPKAACPCLRLLLENRLPLDCRGRDGHLPAAEWLLQHRANPQGQDAQGHTALHGTRWQGQLAVTWLLLRCRAEVDTLEGEQRPALHSATRQSHANTIQLLLNSGTRRNQACSQGATALGIDAQEGHAEVARVLLEQGAEPCRGNGYVWTPTCLAAHWDAILRLLERHGAQPPLQPRTTTRPAPTPPSSMCRSLAAAPMVPADSRSVTRQLQQLSLPQGSPPWPPHTPTGPAA